MTDLVDKVETIKFLRELNRSLREDLRVTLVVSRTATRREVKDAVAVLADLGGHVSCGESVCNEARKLAKARATLTKAGLLEEAK